MRRLARRSAALSLATPVAACLVVVAAPPLRGAGPVPARFAPASASFVSGSRGFVLGTAPCPHAPCTSLVATSDGGRTWVGSPAPRAPLSATVARGVSRITFASSSDGWSWGPSLWATHDGGTTWSPVHVGGPVSSLQASGGFAYAIVLKASGTSGRPSAVLERTPQSHDAWRILAGVAGPLSSMTWHGRAGWVVTTPAPDYSSPKQIWRTTNAGATWVRLPDPCYRRSAITDVTGLASPDGTHLFELCSGNPGAGEEGKAVLASSDGGTTARLAGRPPLGGLAISIAAASAEDLVVAASSGAGFLYRSTDGGGTWSTKMLADGGAGLSDLAFPAPRVGVVVNGHPGGRGPDRLLMTRDGGATWSAVPIVARG